MKIKSRKLRNSAKGQPCTIRLYPHCTGGGEDSVLCHIQVRGGTMGGKESDYSAAIGCYGCHSVLDGHAPTQLNKHEILRCAVRGMIETHEYWIEQGLIEVKA